MKVLINFADSKFRKQQLRNTKTALTTGGFDKVIEYSYEDIDSAYLKSHDDILSTARGSGLWLWKPYFINKTFEVLNDGDYLFYCDAGSYFVDSIDLLISCMEANSLDIMPFECPLINLQFSKREFISANNCEESWLYGNQIIGTFLLLKVSDKSRFIINEFLRMCEIRELICDSDSLETQHPMFIDHRHDQTILSYLMWKHKIAGYRDPSQYGFLPLEYIKFGLFNKDCCLGKFRNYNLSTYPMILYHYRKRNIGDLIRRKLFEIKTNLKILISPKVQKD